MAKSRLTMILFLVSVHQKYLKQVTFHTELALAFLSVGKCPFWEV